MKANKGWFKKGHKPCFVPRLFGSSNPIWKGGRNKTDGRVRIRMPDHPFRTRQGWVLEHRLVMEKHLGRYLRPEEVVHHINGIKDDNRIENLVLFANTKEHTKYHNLYQWQRLGEMADEAVDGDKSVLNVSGRLLATKLKG